MGYWELHFGISPEGWQGAEDIVIETRQKIKEFIISIKIDISRGGLGNCPQIWTIQGFRVIRNHNKKRAVSNRGNVSDQSVRGVRWENLRCNDS